MIDLLEKYKLVRRVTLLWFVILTTYVTLRLLHTGQFNSTCYMSLVGLFTVTVSFYNHARVKDVTYNRMPPVTGSYNQPGSRNDGV